MLGCSFFSLCLLLAVYQSSSHSWSSSEAACAAKNILFYHSEGSKREEVTCPRITTWQGVLEGRIQVTRTGFEYNSFQGIPYARPPTGELRFQNPQPAGKWEGILDATTVGSACCQNYEIWEDNQEEDCLFLNVYVPRTHGDNRLFPVMVWIHGGGFLTEDGSPLFYGPDLLVERNVIIVTLNYRLGVFGFLSLNSPQVPGNAGLKDQSLALKWVRENIHHFNGDENQITIFGESAGAASVHYHTLSPMSRGLFNRAIIQSGAANCMWALQKDPESVAFKLAKELGFATDSKDEAAAFLRTVPVKDLIFVTFSPSFTGKIQLPFAPSIEQIFPNTEAFITRTPQELLRSGDFENVPILAGLVTAEGMVYRGGVFLVPADSEAVNNNLIPDLKRFVPDALIAKYGENGVDEIEAKIRQFYFPTTNDISEGLTKLYSDFLFVKDVVATLKTFAERSSAVYYYKFSYSGSRNIFKILSGFNYTGAAHSDELGYIFDISYHDINQIPATESDILITELMVKLWTDFAKYGNPTPEGFTEGLPIIWNPVKPSEVVCLNIDEDLKMTGDPFEESVTFWKSIYEM